eukprot:UN18533
MFLIPGTAVPGSVHYDVVLWTLFPRGIGWDTQGLLNVYYETSAVPSPLLRHYSYVSGNLPFPLLT